MAQRMSGWNWFLLICILTAWASAKIITRELVSKGIAEPMTLMSIRYGISSMVTAGFAKIFFKKEQLKWDSRYLFGGLFVAAQAILLGIALKTAPVSLAGVCFFGCSSLVSSVYGLVTNRQEVKIHLFALLISLCGLLLISDPTNHATWNAGIFLAILGGVFWGGYLLWCKHQIPEGWIANIIASSRTMGIGAIICFSFIYEPNAYHNMNSLSWGAAVYMGIVPQAIGFVLFGWLAPKLNHTQLGVSQLGTPLLVAFGGILLLGEDWTFTLGAGMIFILSGIALASKKPKPQPARKEVKDDAYL
jgi:drug/metabolite transporter (DMT)-like permease